MRTVLTFVAALAFALLAVNAPAVEVTLYPFPDGKLRILVSMKGQITEHELRTIQREIDPKWESFVLVLIESPGGDWSAAMELGRFLREIGGQFK